MARGTKKRWLGTEEKRKCDFCLISAEGKGAAAWYLLLTYMCFVKFQQNVMTRMRKKGREEGRAAANLTCHISPDDASSLASGARKRVFEELRHI